MATLVLSAVGSAVAGPFGSAIGGLIGRQVDQSIFGSGSIEGPRITELAVTTSSYGQAIPRRFGRTRVPGTIIWATDLVESSESHGGKGQPSRTSYSYSVSFAVAVSSTPISRIGRVWAEGDLLIGADSDMKVGGAIRTYLGHGDDTADPLIEADQGADTPAFRDCAYVVFEDLQLEEFGNRIPALTFEVFASENTEIYLGEIAPKSNGGQSSAVLPYARGFSDEGGPVSSSLKAIDRVYPLTAVSTVNGVLLTARDTAPDVINSLPEQIQSTDNQDQEGRFRKRSAPSAREPIALRYYDESLDYQPGVQRALGRRVGGSEVMIDLPATMTAQGAKDLVNAKAHQARWHQERMTWISAILDPAVSPGSVVTIPEVSGIWQVTSWEWNERGIVYALRRMPPELGQTVGAAPGKANTAADIALSPTILAVFEVPPLRMGDNLQPEIYAAATSASSVWRGAALYIQQGESLLPIGPTNPRRAITGTLVGALGASQSLLVEANSAIEVQLPSSDLGFDGTDMNGIAAGYNRLLVGAEVLQYLEAEPVGNNRWKLTGLLRGRAGTEDYALVGHTEGASVTVLNNSLTPLGTFLAHSSKETIIAAIGATDPEAASAPLQNAKLSLRPPSPVHPRISYDQDGSLACYWTRRARGAWLWEDGADTPLVEEKELYTIGFGPVASPHATWTVADNTFSLSPSDKEGLTNEYGAGNLWVKQVGTHAKSPALLLTSLT